MSAGVFRWSCFVPVSVASGRRADRSPGCRRRRLLGRVGIHGLDVAATRPRVSLSSSPASGNSSPSPRSSRRCPRRANRRLPGQRSRRTGPCLLVAGARILGQPRPLLAGASGVSTQCALPHYSNTAPCRRDRTLHAAFRIGHDAAPRVVSQSGPYPACGDDSAPGFGPRDSNAGGTRSRVATARFRNRRWG
jgi:hypothetical protein